jgi:hypothetical protein
VRRLLWGAVALVLAMTVARPAVCQEEERPSRRRKDRLGWYTPDFVRLQTGGYHGRIGVGVGYAALGEHLEVAGLYGYTPPAEGVTVHSAALTVSGKLNVWVAEGLRITPFYAGVGILYTYGPNFFSQLPERYPPGYYPPTAYHPTAHVGVAADWHAADHPAIQSHGLYAELVTTYTLLKPYVNNHVPLDVTDVIALALGYRAAFLALEPGGRGASDRGRRSPPRSRDDGVAPCRRATHRSWRRPLPGT